MQPVTADLAGHPAVKPERGNTAAVGEDRRGHRFADERPSARLPLVLVLLPDRDVPLADVDAGTAEARDHLGVSRIRALVRPEIEDAE